MNNGGQIWISNLGVFNTTKKRKKKEEEKIGSILILLYTMR